MQLTSSSFDDGAMVPGTNSFCIPSPDGKAQLGPNRNPHLAWDEVPGDTQSFALICVDTVVPTAADDVNQEGREVPEDLPRGEFFHWVVVDLPPELREIHEGEFADGVVPHGQQTEAGPHGCRQGINDYTGWFAGDEAMAGDYFGYDGPCPPWNDSLIHEYTFTLYALDVAHVPVGERFTGSDVRAAIAGHELAAASLSGSYTLNPRLLG